MTDLLTAAQMRAIEHAAIESGETTGLELMERAGTGVVEAIQEEWPDMAKTPQKAVALCGPGNNGGDGFVVARLLKQRGWEVEVFLYGEVEKLPPDAKTNAERWLEMGPIAAAKSIWQQDRIDKEGCTILTKQDLFIDAAYGIGLSAPLATELEPFYETGRNGMVWDYKVVAIDIPSGLHADTGEILDDTGDYWCIQPDLTVTFHKLKRGHTIGSGPKYCGKVIVKSLGL